jgi:5'(3')-deoxyribonucleotidase
LEIAKNLDYKIMILTQGPRTNPSAWSGKKKWIDKNLPETDITITRDKGLVYGKILVDDFPEYIERWLTWRKRGLVIMPANSENAGYKNPQVIRYDGANLDQIRNAMLIVKKRKAREPLKSIT